MKKRKVFFLGGIFLCLFALGFSFIIRNKPFYQFVEKFHKITLPYNTRTIEESKENSIFRGTKLELQDSIYYVPPQEFESDYWTIEAYAAERFRYGGMDVLLFYLTGDCENGSSLSPMLELCSYKNGKMVSRLIIAGGYYGEYDHQFYESTIEKNGIIRVIEKIGEYDVVVRQEKQYKINSDGQLILEK